MTDDPTEHEASIRRRLVAVQNGRMYQADHQRSAPGDIEWLLTRLDAERSTLAAIHEAATSDGRYLNPEEVLFVYAVASRANSSPDLPPPQLAEVQRAVEDLRRLRKALTAAAK